MQTCELCGWDTRSDARVCASCRRAGGDEQPVDGSDATQLLTAVLQAARDEQPSDGEGSASADPPLERLGGHVVLREVEPDAPDGPSVARSQRPHPSSVAASLVAALSPATDTDRHSGAPIAMPDDGDHATADRRDDTRVDGADGGQTADDDRSGDHDDEPSDDIFDDQADDTSDDQAGETSDDQAHDTDDEAGVASDDRPQPTGADLAAAATDDEDDTTDELAHAGDDQSEPETDTADDHPDDAGHDQTTAPSGDQDDTARAGEDRRRDDTEPATRRQRLRSAFEEMGAWAAVAQLGLLLIALLCVFQVVVLLVVYQFLAQAQPQVQGAELLVAHGRATDIMVPTLIGCTFVAVVFAAWQARRGPGDPSGAPRQWMGMPLRLWSVTVVAGMTLVLVLLDTPVTVEQARQTTLWAIAACALLGVVSLLSPRTIVLADGDRAPATSSDDVGDGDAPERRAA